MLKTKLLSVISSAAPTDPQFNLTTLLLPGNGTNGAQNNTFVDSSSNNFTITRNGNTTQGTFSPFSQTGWSFLPVTNFPYLTFASNSAFDFGTGDFTVEFWFYGTSINNNARFLSNAVFNAAGIDISWESGSSRLTWYINGSAYATSTLPQLNRWNHIAFSRSGTTFRVFLNGALSNTYTGMSVNISSGNALRIGAYWDGSNTIDGNYMSNLRFVKGTALYTSAFTPSTTPLTAVANTSLLTLQSNRFIDNSVNNFVPTVNGTCSVQPFSPFAPTIPYSTATVGGSGYFDGNGDFLSFTNNSSTDLGTGDFTFEGWVYPTVLTSFQMLFGAGGVNNYFALRWGVTNNVFGLNAWNGTQDVTSTSTTPFNQWVHFAFVRSAGTLFFYLNGASMGSAAFPAAFGSSTGTATVGHSAFYPGQHFVNGYLTNVRMIKGQALTSGAFTPPTAPVTSSSVGWTGANVASSITGTVSLLLNYTNAGIIDSTAKNDLETVGNAQISTAQSRFGGASMFFDGNGDFLYVADSPQFTLGSANYTMEMWVYPTSFASAVSVLSYQWDNAGGTRLINLSQQTNGTYLAYYNGASGLITTTNAVVLNAWNHLALVRNGNTFTMYINGVSGGSVTDPITYSESTLPVVIGSSWNVSGGANFFTGFIDELRITRGFARYTANFTPPSAPFPLQ